MMFLERVEIYALFERTKWTHNLRWEDQNRFQGPGAGWRKSRAVQEVPADLNSLVIAHFQT